MDFKPCWAAPPQTRSGPAAALCAPPAIRLRTPRPWAIRQLHRTGLRFHAHHGSSPCGCERGGSVR